MADFRDIRASDLENSPNFQDEHNQTLYVTVAVTLPTSFPLLIIITSTDLSKLLTCSRLIDEVICWTDIVGAFTQIIISSNIVIHSHNLQNSSFLVECQRVSPDWSLTTLMLH